ncbi:MAG: hypothetical protein HY583_00715 [Candidatus Omnitrophica bacterium]|nr:hypothetical protein [Candidatus Omnitrophota bacterium]
MNLKKIRIRTFEFIQYLLFRLLCFLLNLIPFSIAKKLGRLGGRVLYHILARYRKVALENIRLAFQEKTDFEVKKIAIQSFENLGLFAIEFIRIPKIVRSLSKYVVLKNEEVVLKELEVEKRVIFVISHFGNWEWMALVAGKKATEEGVSISAVARPLGNPWIYNYAKRLRGATGLKTIDRRGAARETIKLVENDQIVSFTIDQHERLGSIPVPYFGREAWTTYLPAMLAIKKDLAVIPVFSYRQENGPTLVKLGEPFPVIRTGN